jgi:hypothetical protein
MYFFRFRLVPMEDHPERDRMGEAWVCCWIERGSVSEAEEIARQDIRNEKWSVVEREWASVVTEADYSKDDDLLSYYKQALVDKEVFLYHFSPRYPVYWVTASVKKNSSAELALAHYFCCNALPQKEWENVYDPSFWTGKREREALKAARDAIGRDGWTLISILEKRPCGQCDVPEDLAPYYDEAEGSGSCVVFIHHDNP